MPRSTFPFRRTLFVRAFPPCRLPACQALRPASSKSQAPTLDLLALDRKWQSIWPNQRPQRVPKHGASKSYVLAMFPYPSGALHMGHVRVYTIADVLARFRRMRGDALLYPMGWDAFGLPAENAAYERGVEPANWTKENVGRMKKQLQGMNTDLDWSREIMSCDPTFYKHTQKLFLMLHEHGLAYQDEAMVNFDPIDRTVLANEQVDSNGYSWRSGAKVEQRMLKQWFLKITAFKEGLLDDMKLLEAGSKWPERVIAMQKHWLGRSIGAKVKFPVELGSGKQEGVETIKVFTTRPDTLFGVQHIAISASHPVVRRLRKEDPELDTFVDQMPLLGSDSKAGFRLGEIHATNPLSLLPNVHESLKDPLPVFVAPYVLDKYGEGAVMGVPGHDARDWAFWVQNSPSGVIRQVVTPDSSTGHAEHTSSPERPFESHGILREFCGKYAGLGSKIASEHIVADLNAAGGLAEPAETWRLRDWLISRQRYWGTPIPIIHCSSCGAVPVPDSDLPVTLPALPASSFQHKMGNPLSAAHEWLHVRCPSCGGPAERDTDTMDTFMCSSWYMFRFADPHHPDAPFSPQAVALMLPVDVYVGGIEHAILHLLYARFMAKFLATTSLWPAGANPAIQGEPFRRLISQGMVHGRTFVDPSTGQFLRPDDVDTETDRARPRIRASGQDVVVRFEKMSKSKHNGVDPAACVARHGADALRAHILFAAPVADVLEWDEAKIAGVRRWLLRVWRLVSEGAAALATAPKAADGDPFPRFNPMALDSQFARVYALLAGTSLSVSKALAETCALNTCISDLMTLTNSLAAPSIASYPPSFLYHTLSVLTRLLAPFAPALAEESWQTLHDALQWWPKGMRTANLADEAQDSVFDYAFPGPAEFPGATEAAAQSSGGTGQTCVVMENGRKRLILDIGKLDRDRALQGRALEEWAVEQIKGTEEGKRWLERKEEQGGWKRIVVVEAGRTVNIVS